MENNNLVIALIVVVVFLITLPVVFTLIKRDNNSTPFDNQQQPQQQIQQPPELIQAPPVIVQPNPIIIAPIYGFYDRGWSDARRRIPPQHNNPEYSRGYRDYCHRYPQPGFNFHLNIR